MVCGNMKFISSVRISEISCTTREMNFQASMYCSVYYIKIALLPNKNRAVNLTQSVCVNENAHTSHVIV